jgi:hypothetical protein
MMFSNYPGIEYAIVCVVSSFLTWRGGDDMETILIILLLLVIFGGGGGYYWSRRGR